MKKIKLQSSLFKKHHNASPLINATLILVSLTIFTVFSMIYFHAQVSKFSATGIDNTTQYSHHYAYISDSITQNDPIYLAAKAEGAANNAYVEYMGNDLDISYSKLQLMDIAIAADVDGIIVRGDESEGMTESIYKASKKGIPVITAGEDCSGSAKICYVGVSNYTLGQEYGKQIIKMTSGNIQDVLILMSPAARSNGQSLTYSGLHDCLMNANYSKYFSIDTRSVGDGTIFSSEEDISDIFSQDDLPDIIVCLDETNTTCACQAIVDYNRVGECTIMGYSSNDTILNAIEKNILFVSFTVDSDEIGKISIDNLNEYLSTGFVTQYNTINITKIDSSNVSSYIASSKEVANES